ncbi:hypothetical protein YB2330_001019 [Saitoella coloradoensis]
MLLRSALFKNLIPSENAALGSQLREMSSLRRRPDTGLRTRLIRPTRRPPPPTRPPTSNDTAAASTEASTVQSTSLIPSPLDIPVIVPDDPLGLVKRDTPAAKLLEQPALVVERQIEMMNVFLGFEQANKYVLMDPAGQHVGYMAEEDLGMMGTLQRQAFRTHRAFKAHVLDREGREVLTIQRPFSYINSKIKVFTDPGLSDSTLIGESQQQWHLTRRKYNLFHNRSGTMEQFALINEPMLSWDFSLVDESGGLVGSVNRNFAGFARELFTDTGNYVLRMDASSHQTTSVASNPAALPGPAAAAAAATAQLETKGGALVPVNENDGLTLDQRAVMLATAVSIDFDYFSKLSGHGGGMGFMPLWFPFPGTTTPPAEVPGAAGGDVAGGAAAGAGGVADAGTLTGAEGMRDAWGNKSGDASADAWGGESQGQAQEDRPWWEQGGQQEQEQGQGEGGNWWDVLSDE